MEQYFGGRMDVAVPFGGQVVREAVAEALLGVGNEANAALSESCQNPRQDPAQRGRVCAVRGDRDRLARSFHDRVCGLGGLPGDVRRTPA